MSEDFAGELRGPAEARLLYVERGSAFVRASLDRLLARVTAAEQLAWASWSRLDRAGGTPTPTPTPTPAPTQTGVICGGCCAGVPMPASIPFVDSIFGAGTLQWNGTAWTACLSGLAYQGGAPCSPATIAIHYTLTTSCQLGLAWAGNAATFCPAASTCATPTTFGSAAGTITTNCTANPATVSLTMGTDAPSLHLRAGHSSHTITASIPYDLSLGTCTPISGTVTACSGLSGSALAGLPVTVADAAGATIWTGTTSGAGGFTAAVQVVGTQTLTFGCDPTSVTARVGAGSTTHTVTAGTTYSGTSIGLPVASGYHCWAYPPFTECALPIADSLTLTAGDPSTNGYDYSYPDDTLVYTSSPPGYCSGIGASDGWLGSASFTLPPGAGPSGNCAYWFSGGSLFAVLTSPPSGPSATTLGSGAPTTCPAGSSGTFSWGWTSSFTWSGFITD